MALGRAVHIDRVNQTKRRVQIDLRLSEADPSAFQRALCAGLTRISSRLASVWDGRIKSTAVQFK